MITNFFSKIFHFNSKLEEEEALIVILGTDLELMKEFIHDYLKVDVPLGNNILFSVGKKNVFLKKANYFSCKYLSKLFETIPKYPITYCYIVKSRSKSQSFLSKRAFFELINKWKTVVVKKNLIERNNWEPLSFDEAYRDLDEFSEISSVISTDTIKYPHSHSFMATTLS